MTGRKLLIAATATCCAMMAGGALANDGTDSKQPLTDTVITTKVKAELVRDDSTKATDINVDTKNGVVSLNGAVGSDTERDLAEANARSVEGVVAVKNNLRVASK